MDRARGTAWARNLLAGFEDSSNLPRTLLNRAQAALNSRILVAHKARPPPGMQQFSGSASAAAESEGWVWKMFGSACLATDDRARLSLPRDQSEPGLLEEILPTGRGRCFRTLRPT